MKKLLIAGLATVGLGAGALSQNLPSSMPASGEQPRAGFLKSVEGTVRIIDPAGSSRAATTGDALGAADRIETESGAGASVVLRDGTTMVVGPSSRLDLKQFDFNATTREGNIFVALLRGSLRMVTGLIGKTHPEAIRVDTQTATIGIRGTDFIVNADDGTR